MLLFFEHSVLFSSEKFKTEDEKFIWLPKQANIWPGMTISHFHEQSSTHDFAGRTQFMNLWFDQPGY